MTNYTQLELLSETIDQKHCAKCNATNIKRYKFTFDSNRRAWLCKNCVNEIGSLKANRSDIYDWLDRNAIYGSDKKLHGFRGASNG